MMITGAQVTRAQVYRDTKVSEVTEVTTVSEVSKVPEDAKVASPSGTPRFAIAHRFGLVLGADL